MERKRLFSALTSTFLLFAALLALSSGQPQATVAAPTYTTGSQAKTLLEPTAAALAGTYAPPRDLVALTQRLRLGGNGSVPEMVNSTPPNYPVGTRHEFN